MDGARNPKIQSIYLDKFPIHQAAFAAGGTHVVASSRRRHFYTFDLASASVEKVCFGLAPSALSRIASEHACCRKDLLGLSPHCSSISDSLHKRRCKLHPIHGAASAQLQGDPPLLASCDNQPFLGCICMWMPSMLVLNTPTQLIAASLRPTSPVKVAGLVGRPEKSLETFAACPAPDNPLVAFLGNEGCVPLVSLRSRQCVGELKMSGAVRTAAFSGDGQELLTSGRPPC